MIGRIVAAEQSALVAVSRVIANMSVVMAVVMAVVMIVRSDIVGDLCGHQGGSGMSRWAMGQDDDKRSNQQRKDGCQRDHTARRIPSPAMVGLPCQALPYLVLSYPP